MPPGHPDSHETIREFSFGVVPQQVSTAMLNAWQPLLDDVGARAGVRLRFATATDLSGFELRLAKGEYDIAYMNPYEYVMFHEAQGYEAFAREKDKILSGVIVVRTKSGITELEQLRGQRVAFPSEAAFAASMVPRGHLRELGLAVEPVYVGSHDSVYHDVAKGLFPAGGGIRRTLDLMPSAVRDELTVIWQSRGYSPHAIAALPRRVPTDVAQAIRDAMVALEQDPEGLQRLRALSFTGFSAATDEDWGDIRALRANLEQGQSQWPSTPVEN